MIYLASRSPRRRALLDQIGVRYRVLSVSLPETPRGGERPRDFVRRMARAKAELGRGQLVAEDETPVLGADTAVIVDGEILGKPSDEAHARRLIERLSGRDHQVLTAVALATREASAVRLNVSRVWFRALSRAECRAYCATAEPLDKAGGYAIQGLAAAFVRRLEGSHSGVMGLPLFETAELLRSAGIEVLGGGA